MRSFFSFVVFPVLLSSVGEFILKHAVNKMDVALTPASVLMMAGSPSIWAGSACIVVSGLLWVIAMSRYQLSFIYPFFSLNFIVIMLGSHFLLREEINLVRYLAVVLIIIGLIFISRSKFSDAKVG